jgi:hypothetical protein
VHEKQQHSEKSETFHLDPTDPTNAEPQGQVLCKNEENGHGAEKIEIAGFSLNSSRAMNVSQD